MSTRTLLCLALAISFGTAAAKTGNSAGGGGGLQPNPGIAQERRLSQDRSASTNIPSRDAPPGVQIEGTVRDGSGRPMGNVIVKLFSGGVVSAAAETSADGKFLIEANPRSDGSRSTVLWVQSPDPGTLLDAHAVLVASKVAEERSLFPPCVERVQVGATTAIVDVQLMTETERQRALEISNCMAD